MGFFTVPLCAPQPLTTHGKTELWLQRYLPGKLTLSKLETNFVVKFCHKAYYGYMVHLRLHDAHPLAWMYSNMAAASFCLVAVDIPQSQLCFLYSGPVADRLKCFLLGRLHTHSTLLPAIRARGCGYGDHRAAGQRCGRELKCTCWATLPKIPPNQQGPKHASCFHRLAGENIQVHPFRVEKPDNEKATDRAAIEENQRKLLAGPHGFACARLQFC